VLEYANQSGLFVIMRAPLGSTMSEMALLFQRRDTSGGGNPQAVSDPRPQCGWRAAGWAILSRTAAND